MVAVAYATLPVIPTFDKVHQQLEKGLSKPLERVSRQAGDSIEKGMQAGVQKAEVALNRLRKLEADRAKDAVDAEKKVANAREALDIKTRTLAAQEKQLVELRDAGKDTTAKELQIAKTRLSVSKATDQLTSASRDLIEANNRAAEASEKVIAAQKRLDNAVAVSEKRIGGLERAFDSVKRGAARGAAAMGEFAQKAQVHASLAVGAIGLMGKAAADYAAEAEQSYGAVESIFKDHASAINDASKKAADVVGMSGRAYREQSAYIGAMLKNQGVPMDEFAGKTQELVALGSDLAATFGGSTADAVQALGATLRGETDPIERYGVSIKQADIDTKAASMGLGKLDGEAGKAAKTQALLALITEKTADAQGQFARETDTAAHKQQVAKAKYDDAKEALGTGLLPIYAEVAEKAALASKAIGEHPKLFTAIGAAIAGIGGSIVVIGSLATAVGSINALLVPFELTLGGIIAAAAPWVAAFAAITAAVWAFFTKTEIGQKIWGELVEKIKQGIDWIKDAFVGLKDLIADGDYTGLLRDAFGFEEDSPVVDRILTIRDAVIDAFGKIREVVSGATDWASGMWQGLTAGISEIDFSGIADALEPVRRILTDSLSGTFESIVESGKSIFEIVKTLVSALAGAFMDALQGVWSILKRIWDVIGPMLVPALKILGAIIGGVVIGAIVTAAKVVGFLAWGFSKFLDVVEAVTKAIAGPLISVIGTVAHFLGDVLGGAISLAKDLFIGAVHLIGDAWSGMVSLAKAAWESVLKPVFSAIGDAAGFLFTVVSTALISPFLIAWNLLAAGAKAVWEGVLKPVFQALGDFAKLVWETLIQPVFEGIKVGFQAVGDFFTTVWQSVIQPAWQAFGDGVRFIVDSIVKPAFDAVVGALKAVGDFFTMVWQSVIQPAWKAFGDGVRFISDAIVIPAFRFIMDGLKSVGDFFTFVWQSVIKPAWDAFGNGIRFVVDSVVHPVFEGIKSALGSVRDAFSRAVEWIGKKWADLRELTAAPVRFIVNTVYNDGIRKAWNTVAKWVGQNELPEHKFAYARGGILPGYTPGRDPFTFIEPTTGLAIGLSGGEAIMRPEVARALGPDKIDALNAAARLGGIKAVRKELGNFYSGGVIGSISDAVRKHFPGMTITSTYRAGDPGWHGKGKAVDFSDGFDDTPGMQRAASWFFANYGKGLLELIHSPFPHNVKNGQDVGNGFGFYGAATMNGHRNHVHVAAPGPLGDPKVMVEMIDSAGGGGAFQSVLSMIKPLWDKAINAIPKFSGKGMIGELPAAFLKKAVDTAWKFVAGKAEESGYTGSAGMSGKAESWRDMAMAAMRRNGFNADDPAQVKAMLSQIMSESGGNPNIAQQIVDVNGTGESAGVGLLQIIPGTFAANRDPSLPNDRRDPWANMNAALRYYKGRYGTDLTRMWGHGHGYADGGVLPGYTPGRDVYDFIDPRSGLRIGLSGGEGIMVPEWVRAVGGAKAVEAMNVAARSGRSVTRGQRFASGGVFQGGSGFDKLIQEQIKAMQELGRNIQGWSKATHDATGGAGTNIGAFLRGSSFKEIFDLVSGSPFGELVSWASSVVNAYGKVQDAWEKQLGAADSMREAEKKLAEARASGDVEKIGAAEKDLAAARETVAEAAKSSGLAEIRMVLAVISLIGQLFKSIWEAAYRAKTETAKAYAQVLEQEYEWASMLAKQRQVVAALQAQQVEHQIKLGKATWDLRLAQADVVRTQLAGVKSVADAEAKLKAERERAARKAMYDYKDMSLEYDRYRWKERQGLTDRLSDYARVTPEILALEHEVNVAKLTALQNQRQASLAALQASWAQQEAALDLQKTNFTLMQQTKQLALMQAQYLGMDQAGALTGANTAKLYAEKAKAEGRANRGFFGWVGSFLTSPIETLKYVFGGGRAADNQYAQFLAGEILKREANGKGLAGKMDPAIEAQVKKLFAMGLNEQAENLIKSSALGDPDRAIAEAKENQQLLDIENAKKELELSIQRNKAFADYEKQMQAMRAEVEALKSAAASEQYKADSIREKNPAVKSALAALAEFETGRSREYRAVARGDKQTVEIKVPDQDLYTREQVDALLKQVQQIDSLDARVTVLESPAKPSALDVMGARY
ncbi:hypothetical protein CIP107578_00756 [Corynebacterium diphtheriae]|nr:hypothetical protein CIP107558_00754 [Corynebacterium diphtheriae]CAB0640077.1 hypothetical protein CIP107578_00756 [Corynebacterium diphtheriae]